MVPPRHDTTRTWRSALPFAPRARKPCPVHRPPAVRASIRASRLGVCVLALASLSTPACSKAADEAPKRDEVESAATDPAAKSDKSAKSVGGPPASPSAESGVQADGEVVSAVHWFEGELDAALAKAKAEDKRVLVDIGAYWCPPCHRLDEELFTVAAVGQRLDAEFVAVHVDAEQGAGPELVERYDVQAYPTMLVLESTGVERGRIVDFVAPKDFFAALDRIERGENVLVELEAAAATSPDDLELAYKAGHAYALAAKRDDAERHFARVLAGDPNDEAGLASKVLYDRAMFLAGKLDHDPQAAVDGYRALQAKYPESKSALRAYRQIGRQLNKLGRADEAIASLDAMLATAPKDTGLRSSYGWFCFRQKAKPERGLQVVLEGLEAAPNDADLHYLAAELHAATGDPTAGLEHMRKASELEPKRAYYRRQVKRFEALSAAAGSAPTPGPAGVAQ